MAKTFLAKYRYNLTGLSYTPHFIDMVTWECLLHATTAVMHALDTWAGGSFRYVTFEVDIDTGKYNTVWDACN